MKVRDFIYLVILIDLGVFLGLISNIGVLTLLHVPFGMVLGYLFGFIIVSSIDYLKKRFRKK